MRFPWQRKPAEAITPAQKAEIVRVFGAALQSAPKKPRRSPYAQELKPYEPFPGVVPMAEKRRAMAQDATPYSTINSVYGATDLFFPGYQVLAEMAQLPEYRKLSDIIAKEMTRKWIKLTTIGDEDKSDKIAALDAELKRLDVQGLFRRCAELDGFFGRGQLYIDVNKPSGGTARDDLKELQTPLALDPRKIVKGSLNGFTVVEPMWTYPAQYNASDPLDPGFYRPQAWYVMGKTVHRSRLLRFVSREVPDILKPAYNFGGLSLTQISRPYVDHWLRTRDSVADIIHSFSTSGILTNLASVLAGGGAEEMLARAELFAQLRDNRGLMLLDKDTEEFFQFNTPLSTLDVLQSQSQEQVAAIASIPLVKFWGLSPHGLNASSEGEIRVFYDEIESRQEHLFRPQLEQVLKIVQLHLFGEIDPDIGFDFEPLYSMDEEQQAAMRKAEAETDAVLVSIGAISPDEVRARLAADPNGGYNSLDVDDDLTGELDERSNTLEVKDKINDQ